MHKLSWWTRVVVVLVAVCGMATPAGAQAVDETSPAVSAGVSDSIVRLYVAVFDRLPDDTGRDYWVDQYVAGVALPSIASAFMASPEWLETYGVVDDTQFVELMYDNVLKRVPDDGGRDYWRSLLTGGLTRTTMLLGFSESPEFVTITGTASPEPPPPPPPPPFPAVPAHTNVGQRLVYSNSQQRVWWIDANETVVESYLVSGRKGVPTPGTYHVYSKSPVAWAGHDGITMTHMVRFAHSTSSGIAIGFHGIPRYRDATPMQTEAQLGSFRSAGCVRQRDDLAQALYNWTPLGTTVVVLP